MSDPPNPIQPSFFGGNIHEVEPSVLVHDAGLAYEERSAPINSQEEHLEPHGASHPENKRSSTAKSVSRLWALGVFGLFNAGNPVGIILGIITSFLGHQQKQKGLRNFGVIVTIVSIVVMAAKLIDGQLLSELL